MIQSGKVNLVENGSKESFAELIHALNLKSPVVIKPNWGTVECYTEADILDWTLSAIPGEKYVIESHGWARDEETLRKTGTKPLTKAHLRKSDRWFQQFSGIDSVLARHNVEYINLTEEVWAGRCTDPELVRQVVEEQFEPVQFTEHYQRLPQRMFDLRGGSLLSLAKYKVVFDPLGISMAVKNLFGCIPGPSRGKFHGKDHAFLDQNIVDINKIYRSLFRMSGLVEAVHTTVLWEEEAAGGQFIPGSGCAFASTDPVTLDAYGAALAERDPQSIGHLRLAAQTFGAFDPETIALAKSSKLRVMELEGNETH